MSASIFIISLLFGILEGGISWLLLVFQPVSRLFTGVPLWVITGIIFGIGMLLTFILIIIVGSMNVSDRAASFVRDHMGRTVVLAVFSVLAVVAVSIGGEMLYQADPLPMRQEKKADICFVLDYSFSMNGSSDSAMRAAFEQAIGVMEDSQRVCVIKYSDDAALMIDWEQLNTTARNDIVKIVKEEPLGSTTNFASAIEMASRQIDKASRDGRSASIVLMSDGDARFSDMEKNAPTIIQNDIPVYTIFVGNASGMSDNLNEISTRTGGKSLVSGGEVAELSSAMMEVTKQASNTVGTEDTSIVDTLLTERWVTRQTIINARILRILILFLLGFWFKIIAIICIGNNDSSPFVHLLHAFLVALIAALFVEFAYGFSIPVAVVLLVYWILMITQIVRTDR